MPTCPIPLRKTRHWLEHQHGEIMRRALAPTSGRSTEIPFALSITGQLTSRVDLDPVAMCLVFAEDGRPIPRRIVDLSEDIRAEVALAAVAFGSDRHILMALRGLISPFASQNTEISLDLYATASGMLAFNINDAGRLRDSTDTEAMREGTLASLTALIVPTPASHHHALEIAARNSGLAALCSHLVRYLLPESREEIRFADPDFSRLAQS